MKRPTIAHATVSELCSPRRTPITLRSSPISGWRVFASALLSRCSTASTVRSSSSSGAKPTPREVSLASGTAPFLEKSEVRSAEVGRSREMIRTSRSTSRKRRCSRSHCLLPSTTNSSTGMRAPFTSSVARPAR